MNSKALKRVSATVSVCFLFFLCLFQLPVFASEEGVKLGMIYPRTGFYSAQGLDMFRGAEIALDEINAAGGILGKKVELVWRDTESSASTGADHAVELIEKEEVEMIFGGLASSVALAVNEICRERQTLFMSAIAGTPVLTTTRANRYTFKAGFDAVMDAKALSFFLNEHHADQKYFFVSSDDIIGEQLESAIRTLTGTQDTDVHKGVTVPPVRAKEENFRAAFQEAQKADPDVLLLLQYGRNFSIALIEATVQGLKETMQVVVPFIELNAAERMPPKFLEGVIGTADWAWNIPYKYSYSRGIEFVEEYAKRYSRYPSWGAATVYTILHEYKSAVERGGSFAVADVIKALEGHSFTLLKNRQTWRDFDHQCIQSLFIVRGKKEEVVLQDRFRMDYFEILGSVPGDHVALPREQWEALRKAEGLPLHLEPLPCEKE